MSELIQKFLEKNRENKLRIDCIGDAMVDQYYRVSVNRISPEFPMPIMKTSPVRPESRPGGVANVAHQFRNFNVDLQLICFTDKNLDPVLKEHNLQHKIGFYRPSLDSSLGTVPVKQRFLDSDIQVTRLDVEQDNYGLSEDSLRSLREKLYQKTIHERLPDVTILSDYDKGFFGSSINWASDITSKGVTTIVDPKNVNLDQWEGCRIFKPNAKEAYDLSGLTDPKDQSRFFQERLGCESVFITQSGGGVKGVWGSEYFEYVPSQTVSVKSSVGAGDCFVAFLAMAIGHGFEGRDAAEVAYEAGAIYVQRNLNRPITPAELTRTKIVHPQDLANRDYTLAFTNGCFDLIHSGHLQTLRFAAQKAQKLVVALNSDESVKRLKGPERPKKTLSERMQVMAALEMVDFVTYFEEDTPLECIKACQPNALIKGGEYGDGEIVGEDIVPETFRVPMVDGKSTTALLK